MLKELVSSTARADATRPPVKQLITAWFGIYCSRTFWSDLSRTDSEAVRKENARK